MDRGLQGMLGTFHPTILLIAAKLHAIIYELNPAIRMDANVRCKMLLYRMEGEAKPVCTLELHKGVVKLHFLHGALLDDPDGLLKGSGKSRRIILNTPAQAGSAAVRRLLKQAIEMQPPCVAFHYAAIRGNHLGTRLD